MSRVASSPMILKARRSGTGKSSSERPDQGRRWTPENVWYPTYDVMFLRATIASTSARTSGSEVGNGPAPCCSASGAQSAGQLRLRSRPSSGGAIGMLTPSQLWIVPSGSTR